MSEKICAACGLEKDHSEFSQHPRTPDGLYRQCKECCQGCQRSGSSFRKSPRNKELAAQRAHRENSLPNDFSKADRVRMIARWHGCCAVCGAYKFWDLQADHWIPTTSPDCPGTVRGNMIPLCSRCNASKLDHEPTDWLIGYLGRAQAEQRLIQIVEYLGKAGE